MSIFRIDGLPMLVISSPVYYYLAWPYWPRLWPNLFSIAAVTSCSSYHHLYHCSTFSAGRHLSPFSASFLSWLRSRAVGKLHHYSSFDRLRQPDGRVSTPSAVYLMKLMSSEYYQKQLHRQSIKTAMTFLKCSEARQGLYARILSPMSLEYRLVHF